MIGGLFGTSSRLAIVAAGLFAGGAALTPAQAADLGGDCCADLEERVAELEATTVRHANRRVSLTMSGQVNSAVMWWDNGEESDVYVIDNDEASSRLRLGGSGTVTPGWAIGFVIEVDFLGNGTAENDQDDLAGFNVRRANWFVRSDQLGTLSVGQGSMASDGSFETSFSDGWYASVGYGLSSTNMGTFQIYNNRNNTYTGLTWFGVATDNDAGRINRVRYDSPTLAGFTFSTSWGEDDDWDVALRYANEWNGLRVAAAASYREDTDDNGGRIVDRASAGSRTPNTANSTFVNVNNPLVGASCDANGNHVNYDGTDGPNPGNGCIERDIWGGSIAFMHVPSGVHLEGGYSVVDTNQQFMGLGTQRQANSGGRAQYVAVNGVEQSDYEHWWIAAGVTFRASSLGTTDISVQYIENESSNMWVCDNSATSTTCGVNVLANANAVVDSVDQISYTSYGISLVQQIDAVGATAYMSYNRHEAEADDVVSNNDLDADFDQFTAGMRVTF